jgi:hypothetical protein
VGRFSFPTHEIHREGQVVYASVGTLFAPLKGPEQYRTVGFKEIAMVYGTTEESFRKAAALINRVRHQPGATPLRTLHDNTEAEGQRILEAIEQKATEILRAHDFTAAGVPEVPRKGYRGQAKVLAEEQVEQALAACAVTEEEAAAMRDNPVVYEDPEATVNLSIDDVVTKRQKEHRRGPKGKAEPGEEGEGKKRKQVHQTVAHIHQGDQAYVLNGAGVGVVLRLIIGFLLHNGLVGQRLQFFVDGQRSLHTAIGEVFGWYTNVGLLLDWYHLEKKCKERLSLGLTGRQVRNEVLGQLRPLLWNGLSDEAIAYLDEIDPGSIKNRDQIDKLIGYIERNRSHIPCYAVRKQLGLRNSSNRGEKMNDLIVSERQKHNGMSWSKSGSVALAAVAALKRNGESEKWFREGDVEFKLAA